MAEADAVPLDYTVTQAKEVPSWDGCDFLDLWFTGMAGARIYAKYLRPHSDKPVPLVLQFHGYPGASRSFAEQASFAGMGMALIAMDCPGQAGYSVDAGGFLGTTVSGHIVAGLDGPAEGMYYVRLHQNIRILCRIVRQLQEIDLRRVFVNGGSQGGGLGLACCALNPGLINRAAILYPFLSDFKLVWDLGADEIAYEGIRYYAGPLVPPAGLYRQQKLCHSGAVPSAVWHGPGGCHLPAPDPVRRLQQFALQKKAVSFPRLRARGDCRI